MCVLIRIGVCVGVWDCLRFIWLNGNYEIMFVRSFYGETLR